MSPTYVPGCGGLWHLRAFVEAWSEILTESVFTGVVKEFVASVSGEERSSSALSVDEMMMPLADGSNEDVVLVIPALLARGGNGNLTSTRNTSKRVIHPTPPRLAYPPISIQPLIVTAAATAISIRLNNSVA